MMQQYNNSFINPKKLIADQLLYTYLLKLKFSFKKGFCTKFEKK